MSGLQQWWVKCRNCGHEHRICNFGRRKAYHPDGTIEYGTTVHEANCFGWRLLTGRESEMERFWRDQRISRVLGGRRKRRRRFG